MPRPKKVSSDANHPKRVTLQDIADVAGLNVMTVSNALSDARIVAPATRERVKRIARELNYVPNSAAKALVTGRTGLIAIMCGPLDEPYYATAVRLLGRQLNAEGYRVLLTSTETHNIIDATGNTAIDGAIAIDRHDLIEQFQNYSPVPCVSIGTYQRSFIDNVVVDLSEGVGEAVRLMAEAGRQRIAYLVTTFHMAQPSEVRAAAYFRTLQGAGLATEVINVNSNFFDEVEENLWAYLTQHGAPDALLCQNDETAMSAYRALRNLGYRIPEDVLLVGCDGQLHMKYFDPPLSTIAQPLEEMCDTAWKFLKNRIADPTLPVQQAVLQGKLVVRESLGTPN
ncbi:LacI family transcriptional regulator [bacterium]|nr:MAG: LacI family transcriptional regulator [bacterium]